MCLFSRKVNLIVAGMCVAFLLCGCQKAPDAELAEAKAALKAAQDVEADKYMSKNFQNVQRVIEEAEKEIAKQKSAFILTRKYTRVTKLLKNATDIAKEITADAPKAKENIIAQVKENLTLAKNMLKETEEDLKKASKLKDKKKMVPELRVDLSAADSIAIRAAVEFEAGEVLKAAESLDNVQALIKKITDQLKGQPEM
jgi:mannose/fructose/N-acetylgalactosamine-specific phosphotransferase system component IIB